MKPTDPGPRPPATNAASRVVPDPHHGHGQHGELDRHHAAHGHTEHDGLYNEDVAHEHSDVNVRAILMFCGGLVAIAAIVHVAMWGLFIVFENQAAGNDPVLSPLAVPAGQLPPEPRLLLDEPLNLQTIRAEEAQILGGYGWVDQNAGTARIPIDEAKKRLLQQGLPVRGGAPIDPWMGTAAPAQGESSSGRQIPIRPGTFGPQQPAQPAAGQPAPPKPEPPPHKGGH